MTIRLELKLFPKLLSFNGLPTTGKILIIYSFPIEPYWTITSVLCALVNIPGLMLLFYLQEVSLINNGVDLVFCFKYFFIVFSLVASEWAAGPVAKVVDHFVQMFGLYTVGCRRTQGITLHHAFLTYSGNMNTFRYSIYPQLPVMSLWVLHPSIKSCCWFEMFKNNYLGCYEHLIINLFY